MSEHSYYLRSRSDIKQSSVSVSTSSPISPPTSTSPSPIELIDGRNSFNESASKPCTTNERMTRRHTRKRRNHRRRKRKFSQIHNDEESESDNNQDIDLNVATNNNDNNSSNTNKKAKLSRTIKFTLKSNNVETAKTASNLNTVASISKQHKIKRIRLTFNNKPTAKPNNNNNNNDNNNNNNNKQNDETVISREASLAPNSPLIMNGGRQYRRIESFEVPISNRMRRRNPYICCYSFFNDFQIGISMTLGAGNDTKSAIRILSQELVSGRAKASLQTQKNSFLVYIKNRKQKMIACAILHIDHVWKRVNIEMFAVDHYWRGNGFASMMIYLIQYKMIYYNKYDLFVCAANDAVPFWSNPKYHFVFAHKGILEQHEVEDEKHGGTRHLIWFGSCIQARCSLLKCFINSQ